MPQPQNHSRRPVTPTYVVFYLLFSADFWRLVMGIGLSLAIAPKIAPPDLALPGRLVLYMMVAAIGWAITAVPGKWIAKGLRRLFLGDRRP